MGARCWRGRRSVRRVVRPLVSTGTLDAGFGGPRCSAASCGPSTASPRCASRTGRSPPRGRTTWRPGAARTTGPDRPGRLHVAAEAAVPPRRPPPPAIQVTVRPGSACPGGAAASDRPLRRRCDLRAVAGGADDDAALSRPAPRGSDHADRRRAAVAARPRERHDPRLGARLPPRLHDAPHAPSSAPSPPARLLDVRARRSAADRGDLAHVEPGRPRVLHRHRPAGARAGLRGHPGDVIGGTDGTRKRRYSVTLRPADRRRCARLDPDREPRSRASASSPSSPRAAAGRAPSPCAGRSWSARRRRAGA